MKYIDLHTHSNYSDGTCPPSVLVSKAIEKGLAAFALTDHDTVAGIEDAVKAVNEQQAQSNLYQVQNFLPHIKTKIYIL